MRKTSNGRAVVIERIRAGQADTLVQRAESDGLAAKEGAHEHLAKDPRGI